MRRPLALLLLATTPLTVGNSAEPTHTAVSTDQQDAALLAFLDKAYDDQIALSPESQTEMGFKTSYDRLNDYTDAGRLRSRQLEEEQLREMRARFRPEELGESARVSFRLFEYEVERGRESFRFRNLRFPVSTNGSPAGEIPALLINNHEVETLSDANAYIARLRDTERVMREVSATMREQAAAKIVPNKVNFAPARADALRVITGSPFDDGPDSPLMADFRTKVAALNLPAAQQDKLLSDASAALTGPFRRGYDELLRTLDEIEPLSTGNFGAWHLPDGAAYYADRLKDWTTTNLTADQIHALGLRQVATIRQEMEEVKRQIGFSGTLEQFFDKVRTDTGAQFKYPNTEAGREEYLADARTALDSVMVAAPRYFRVLPKVPLEVRAVEKWREKTASTAFYNPPSADGTRPGIFYVNLVDLTQTQKIQVDGIAVHEGAPGHHFQFARQMELIDLPKFRKYNFYGAYGEGWGLYAERLADEMGVYKDAYARFGMLSLQVWRAIRLVVDTGIHAKQWTREQAVDYFHANSSISDTDIAREVDRYFNEPGQATAYMVGELKIIELRQRAERELGPKFDIRDFHEAILSQGALPLDVLDEEVNRYITAKRRALGMTVAPPTPANSSESDNTKRCDYDQNAMLRLDPNTFDQDSNVGFRKLGDRPECRNAAADVIALYIETHQEQLARQWQVPSFKWHEATMRAFAGDNVRAIDLMRESIKPEIGPDEFVGWSEYARPWNEYVKATIAFLKNDRRGLERARNRLAKSPMPAEFAKIDTSQTGGILPSWPQNLDVVDGLIACFGKPYEEAYGSAKCRAAGQK